MSLSTLCHGGLDEDPTLKPDGRDCILTASHYSTLQFLPKFITKTVVHQPYSNLNPSFNSKSTYEPLLQAQHNI